MTNFYNPTTIKSSLTSSTDQQKTNIQKPALWIITTVALVLMILLIFFGNVLVLVTTWLEKRLHHPTKYFIACLAMADLLVGIFSVPIRLYLHFHATELRQVELCRFWNWIDMSCEAASIITLTIISIDRYIKISMPFKHRSFMTTSRSVLLIFLIWLISTGFSTLGLFSYGGSRAAFVQMGHGCQFDNAIYVTITAAVFFFGPLAIMIAMYALIFHIAHRRKKLARRGKLGQSIHSRKKTFAKELLQELKTVRMLLFVVLTFMVCWGPFFTVYLINTYKSNYVVKMLTPKQWQIFVTIFIAILPSFNSLCNPVIYACFDQEYSKGFKNLFYRIYCCKKDRGKLSKASFTQSFRLKDYHSHRTSNQRTITETQKCLAETSLLNV